MRTAPRFALPSGCDDSPLEVSISYLGLLMVSGFDLSGVEAEATFRWLFTFSPPEFSLAMRSAASFASLLGTVPVSSTDLPFFTSTVTLALARLGFAEVCSALTSPVEAAAGAASLCNGLLLGQSLSIRLLLVSVRQLLRRIGRTLALVGSG